MRAFATYFWALAGQALVAVALFAVVVLGGLQANAGILSAGGAPSATVAQFVGALSLMVLGTAAIFFVILLAIGAVLARRWATPQQELANESQLVAQGQYDCDFAESGPRETRTAMRNLGRIARSFDRLEVARRTWLVSVSEELRRPDPHARRRDRRACWRASKSPRRTRSMRSACRSTGSASWRRICTRSRSPISAACRYPSRRSIRPR